MMFLDFLLFKYFLCSVLKQKTKLNTSVFSCIARNPAEPLGMLTVKIYLFKELIYEGSTLGNSSF